MDNDIGWIQVGMNPASPMKILQGTAQPAHDLRGKPETGMGIVFNLFNPFPHGYARYPLHDQIPSSPVSAAIQEFHNLRMAAPLQHGDFPLQTSAGWIPLPAFQLEDALTPRFVKGGENLRRSAPVQPFRQSISVNRRLFHRYTSNSDQCTDPAVLFPSAGFFGGADGHLHPNVQVSMYPTMRVISGSVRAPYQVRPSTPTAVSGHANESRTETDVVPFGQLANNSR